MDMLRREIGLFGATMMGLGSIVGTGVFVSIAVAAGSAGPAVILAVAVAALVATCNGLSSAQLAAAHPMSGGTYEYGHRWLHPSLGFIAGWMFLCAKSASAATAALGFAGYLLTSFGMDRSGWLVPIGIVSVLGLTAMVLLGIRQSNHVNIGLVSVSLIALVLFVVAGMVSDLHDAAGNLSPFFRPAAGAARPWSGFLEACAMMFVAYTGYGRVATLGEEIREPRRNIPMAIIGGLLMAMLLYVAVAFVGVATVGASRFSAAGMKCAAPLVVVVSEFGVPGLSIVLALGAVAAMAGVLLNLILGLSRVVLAMGRRRDIPSLFARLDRSQQTPAPAVVLVSIVIAGLVLLGNVKWTWSFSAFSVLVYYAVTNLAAIRLTEDERMYPRFIPWLGLLSCLFLACWVEQSVWIAGVALIAIGLAWYCAARRLALRKTSPAQRETIAVGDH
jgi:APA family basic amino acid/polyamine antiporter